jgi:hypothetical protein
MSLLIRIHNGKGKLLTSFPAGSYSGYNEWRDNLSLLVHQVPAREIWKNIDKYKNLDFVELINFSDCQGELNHETCTKLYRDFTKWMPKIEHLADADFIRLFKHWHDGFCQATFNAGKVEFA